jgi:hypothetical protein
MRLKSKPVVLGLGSGITVKLLKSVVGGRRSLPL